MELYQPNPSNINNNKTGQNIRSKCLETLSNRHSRKGCDSEKREAHQMSAGLSAWGQLTTQGRTQEYCTLAELRRCWVIRNLWCTVTCKGKLHRKGAPEIWIGVPFKYLAFPFKYTQDSARPSREIPSRVVSWVGVLEVGLGWKTWPTSFDQRSKSGEITEHHKYKSETPGKEHLNSGATLTLK